MADQLFISLYLDEDVSVLMADWLRPHGLVSDLERSRRLSAPPHIRWYRDGRTHRLGERDAGFVPITIDLIEGLIQFWIIAPAAKGPFQVGEPIDANLDLDLRSVWKKNGFLKFDRGSVNFSFYSLCHNTSFLSNILPYLSWLGKERCGMKIVAGAEGTTVSPQLDTTL